TASEAPDLSAFEPTPTPLVLPDFPIPSPTAMVSVGPQGISPDSSAVTRLVAPSLALDTEVKYVPFNGETWLIGGLRQEIAWMGDTSWPGLGGNTGLAGHVDLANGDAGPFWNLNSLKPGDEITIYTQKNRYTYKVREQRVVEDYDVSVLEQTSSPQITLITCTGWDADLRTYLQRLIVYADLVSIQASGS
ncbi:MAG: sortase, partial [Chloroflexota bacterium]